MKRPIARALAGAAVLAASIGVSWIAPAPAGAVVTTTTFTYAGAPVPIPDAGDLSGTSPGAPAVATVPVSGLEGQIIDVDFSFGGSACSTTAGSTTVGLDHTFVNDLEITLTDANTTPVLLIDNTDGSGNNFCQVVLDDDAPAAPNIQTAVTADAPFTGTWLPNSPLDAFDATAANVENGNWTLSVQDFFASDTGSIRAFSITITTLTESPVSGIKTVSGEFQEGGAVTYSVALQNDGNVDATDNPGNEFVDVLPAGLTLVSASATSGTAVASIGTNTVTWNGTVPFNSIVTITINATIDAGAGGTVISNQGTINIDDDADGTNEASVLTDSSNAADQSIDPTTFTVAAAPVTTTSTSTSTTATTAPSSTTTTAAVNSGTLARTGGPRAAGGEAQIGLGLFLAGVGFVLLAGIHGRRRFTQS